MYEPDDTPWSELPPFDPEEPVRTTDTLHSSSSRRQLNQYIRGDKIGKGKHGDVYACRTDDSNGFTMACPIFVDPANTRLMTGSTGCESSPEDQSP